MRKIIDTHMLIPGQLQTRALSTQKPDSPTATDSHSPQSWLLPPGSALVVAAEKWRMRDSVLSTICFQAWAWGSNLASLAPLLTEVEHVWRPDNSVSCFSSLPGPQGPVQVTRLAWQQRLPISQALFYFKQGLLV